MRLRKVTVWICLPIFSQESRFNKKKAHFNIEWMKMQFDELAHKIVLTVTKKTHSIAFINLDESKITEILQREVDIISNFQISNHENALASEKLLQKSFILSLTEFS